MRKLSQYYYLGAVLGVIELPSPTTLIVQAGGWHEPDDGSDDGSSSCAGGELRSSGSGSGVLGLDVAGSSGVTGSESVGSVAVGSGGMVVGSSTTGSGSEAGAGS